MPQLSIDVWVMGAGIIGLIVWFSRLEGKGNYNEKRIVILEERANHAEASISTLESSLSRELSEVKQALNRIEGYLQAKKEAAQGQ